MPQTEQTNRRILALVRDLIAETAPEELPTFDLVAEAELENLDLGRDRLDDPKMGDAAELLFQVALTLVAPMLRDALTRGADLAKPKIAEALLPHLRKEQERQTALGHSKRAEAIGRLCRTLERWRSPGTK